MEEQRNIHSNADARMRSHYVVMSFLHGKLCPGKTSSYYSTVIDNDEALKILKTQSAAARELYSIWKQSTDNNDSMKEKMQDLVSFLVRITDTRQVKGPEILGALKEILEIIKSVDNMCTETGKALHILYFTEGHGENLYKKMKQEEGLRNLNLQMDSDDAEYKVRLDAARKQVAKETAQKAKAAKETQKAGRGDGGAVIRGRGQPRSRGGQHGGWHDHPPNGRGRGAYGPFGGGYQFSGGGGWHPPGGGNPYNAQNPQYQTPFPSQWGQNNRRN